MDSTSNGFEERLTQALRENAELRTNLANARAELESVRSELQKTRALADLAAEELQQFVYAASHDLQEPLRTVSTYSQLLRREYSDDKQAGEFTGFIDSAAKQMTNLVRDLLAYSRTSAPSRPAMMKLSTAVQRAQLKLADRIRDAGAQVTVRDLPEVLADEGQMSQVFEHLIANALTYRSAEAPVIEISFIEGLEFHTITVRDNGPGIEPRFHQQIFLPFKRLHGKQLSGTGLGLTVCRKLVRAHGGDIWVESEGTRGSEFKFTLAV